MAALREILVPVRCVLQRGLSVEVTSLRRKEPVAPEGLESDLGVQCRGSDCKELHHTALRLGLINVLVGRETVLKLSVETPTCSEGSPVWQPVLGWGLFAPRPGGGSRCPLLGSPRLLEEEARTREEQGRARMAEGEEGWRRKEKERVGRIKEDKNLRSSRPTKQGRKDRITSQRSPRLDPGSQSQ